METALLFCAIRAAETLGTVSFSRDTRAGWEIARCIHRAPYSLELTTFCLASPALVLEATGDPRRFGSVTSCHPGAFEKAQPKVRNKIQARLGPGD